MISPDLHMTRLSELDDSTSAFLALESATSDYMPHTYQNVSQGVDGLLGISLGYQRVYDLGKGFDTNDANYISFSLSLLHGYDYYSYDWSFPKIMATHTRTLPPFPVVTFAKAAIAQYAELCHTVMLPKRMSSGAKSAAGTQRHTL
jgi:hypothetical protein